MTHEHGGHPDNGHSHGRGFQLEPSAGDILRRGIGRLLEMTEGMELRQLPSPRYPNPLAMASFGTMPDAATVREEVAQRLDADPISALDAVPALLELCESNREDIAEHVFDDAKLTAMVFSSKRCNGWIAALGDGDDDELESTVNERWQFRFFHAPRRTAGLYALLNALARYSYVYGRIEYGDCHAMSHFVEDHTPGLLVCRGTMSDLEHALSLAAMKLGVPAVVPEDYPFPLGRHVRAETLDEIVESVVAFPNIRRLLRTPDIPQLPSYCRPEFAREEIVPAVTWGHTDQSFYLVRKGRVKTPGVAVRGEPAAPMGVIVTIQGEPLDAFDRQYIEARIASAASWMYGVAAECDGGRLVVRQAEGADLDPASPHFSPTE